MIFKKIQRLTKKAFSSKTYLLLGLNRVVPDNLGKINDIMVDREEKNIHLSLEQQGSSADLSILGYGLEYEGNTAYLIFNKIEKTGYLNSTLKNLQHNKRIKVDPKYIKLVQKMI
jgi:hypothetical protein